MAGGGNRAGARHHHGLLPGGRNGPFGGTVGIGCATSQDGRRTWADGNLPMLTTVVGGPFQLASDAVHVTYGTRGANGKAPTATR